MGYRGGVSYYRGTFLTMAGQGMAGHADPCLLPLRQDLQILDLSSTGIGGNVATLRKATNLKDLTGMMVYLHMGKLSRYS